METLVRPSYSRGQRLPACGPAQLRLQHKGNSAGSSYPQEEIVASLMQELAPAEKWYVAGHYGHHSRHEYCLPVSRAC